MKPAAQRLLDRLEAMLRAFDMEDARAPDRHEEGCICAACEFVGETRGLIALGKAHLGEAEPDAGLTGDPPGNDAAARTEPQL